MTRIWLNKLYRGQPTDADVNLRLRVDRLRAFGYRPALLRFPRRGRVLRGVFRSKV